MQKLGILPKSGAVRRGEDRVAYVNKQKLHYQDFLRRENNTRHHRYDEELMIYNNIKAGDMQGIEYSMNMFTSNLPGRLSHDAVRNYKYLFIASITLATRFSIEGGMPEEDAYTSSDLYIQRMDQCQDVESIVALYRDMLTYFTRSMADRKKELVFSKPVVQCMDYVYYHLHEKLTIQRLAEYVHLNPNYLSGLFKKETGQTVSEYITGKRMEAAKNMLLYSEASCADIASTLAFNSQSYFIKVFRQTFGMTPAAFRRRYYHPGFAEEQTEAEEA